MVHFFAPPNSRSFHTATATLQDAFRIRLGLPQGRIGAIAAVHTFGDYLIYKKYKKNKKYARHSVKNKKYARHSVKNSTSVSTRDRVLA